MKKNSLTENQRAINVALNFLSVRARSCSEIEQKLKLKKISLAVIAETIEALSKQGLLDDAKFAKAYVHSMTSGRGVGSQRLAQDLRRKGVASAAIEQALSECEGPNPKEQARELVLKKIRTMSGLSAQTQKRRLFGFLKRRGYSNDVIYEVLSLDHEG